MAFMSGKRPTAVGLIAVGALVVALSGGVAVAAGSHQNGNKLIKKHTLSANRLVNDTVGAKQVKDVVWHDLELQNGWTVYDLDNTYSGPVQYTKDAQGFLHLRGAISGTGSTSGIFGVLPTGYRPLSEDIWLPVASTNNASDPHLVHILAQRSTGHMAAYGSGGANFAFVSLEGVIFAAG